MPVSPLRMGVRVALCFAWIDLHVIAFRLMLHALARSGESTHRGIEQELAVELSAVPRLGARDRLQTRG